jgi:hypothetical protein
LVIALGRGDSLPAVFLDAFVGVAANPDLHADATIGGRGVDVSVVDVGAKGLKGHDALFITFAASDFSAT